MTETVFLATPVSQIRGIAPLVRITAQHEGTQRQAEFTVLPLLITELSVAPNPVIGGMPVEVTIRFNTFLPEPEPIVVRVGSRMITATVTRSETFKITVPTARVLRIAGRRITLPVAVTVRGQEVTAPKPLVTLAP